MAFNLTDFDRNLVFQLKMRAINQTPVSDFNFRDGEIFFQFPPKIKVDAKSSIWQTEHVASYEPFAFYMGSNARKISLEITYVATGHKEGRVTWDTKTISEIVKDLRGVMYSGLSQQNAPLWELQLYNHLPESGSNSTWRTLSVSERPGDTFINIDGFVYAFRTDVVLELEMITQIAPAGSNTGVQKINNVPLAPASKWY